MADAFHLPAIFLADNPDVQEEIRQKILEKCGLKEAEKGQEKKPGKKKEG